MFNYVRILICALMLALLPADSFAQQPAQITVLAAASLGNVLPDIGKAYEATNRAHVVLSFAASMTLARQIGASAGADVFISADVESMDYLDSRGLLLRGTRRNLLENSLVLIAPADLRVALRIAPGFKIADALQGGRLAMGEPGAVPAGRYARAALMKLGVWETVSQHLALGEDVRAALSYVARGEAPLGIVYSTDAKLEARVRVVAVFPASTHEPIVYPAALIKDANPGAAAFLNFLQGPLARAAFERAGFTVVPRR